MTLPAALLLALPFVHQQGAAAADSAAAAATAFTHAVEGWHDFYLLAGTAAVTLVGLLFVALSFHLDAILDDARADHLTAARMAFLNFVYVLVLSLFFLMPRTPGRILGVGLLTLSLFSFGYIVWHAVISRRRHPRQPQDRFLRRRFGIAGLVYGISIVAAIRLIDRPSSGALIQFMFIAIVTLVNASGIAWDLLVQVGRQRRALGEAPKA